jgi:uncharacterized membrane protein YoaK (UPF0700 family)
MNPTTSREPRTANSLFVLTAVTGLVDAASYLGLGHVFVANMTGNVVLLAFAAAGAPGFSVPRSSAALVAFCVGGIIGGQMAWQASLTTGRRFLDRVYLIEAVLLFSAALTALARPTEPTESPIWLYAVIVLGAVAMGIRNSTVRKLAVPDMTTTVLTLTITGLAADSSLAHGSNPRWRRRSASAIVTFAGAGLGALLLRQSLAPVLAVASALSGTSALMARLEEQKEPPARV